MRDNIKKYLYDIKESADSIFDYLGSQRNFNEYENNKQLRRAVEREFEIIGESVARILRFDPDIKLNNAKRIVSLRNFVIHGYDKVDNVIIWGIISKDLPELLNEVSGLLQQSQ